MKAAGKSFWTKNFIILLISNALLFLAFEMLTPTLPLLADNIGCSPSQIGFIAGGFTISAMIIRPFTDRFKYFMNKKYILIIGVFICVLATGSYIFSVSLLYLLVSRLMHGLGYGISTTYYVTLTSEELPRDRIGEGMGYFGIGETVCMSIGPMAGIGILNSFNFSGLFISGALIFILAALMIFGISRQQTDKTNTAHIEYKNKPIRLIEKRVLTQSILGLLIGITVSGVISFISLFAKQLDITSVAWFFFIAAITGIFIRILSGKIFDKKGPLTVLLPSGLILILAMILISYSKTEFQLNIAGAFYGVAFGAIFPAIQAWTINMVEIESRENAMSSFLNFFDFGFGGGALFLGFIAEATSYKTMYLILISFIVAYLALVIYAVKNKKKYLII